MKMTLYEVCLEKVFRNLLVVLVRLSPYFRFVVVVNLPLKYLYISRPIMYLELLETFCVTKALMSIPIHQIIDLTH